MRRGLILTILLLVMGLITALIMQNSQHPSFNTIEGRIYGTQYKITYAAEAHHNDIRADIEQTLQQIDRIASNWRNDSELSLLNKNPDNTSMTLSSELRELLQLSAELTAFTDGAFDVRFNGDTIDLSGIAKGYAVDRICALLEESYHSAHYLVEIGGEVKALGLNPQQEPWLVGIHIPDAPPLRVQLIDTTMASSGTYFKGHHIKDPKNRNSPQHDLSSCSVIHPSNATADALATALMVMGKDKGLSWANIHNIKAAFILEDGSVHYSTAWHQEP